MNKKKRHKKKNKRSPHKQRVALPQTVSLSDRYLQRGDQLLNSIGDGFRDPERQAQAKQTLDEAIDLILKGTYAYDIERADREFSSGRLSESEHQAQVDQALDCFNHPAEKVSPALIGQTHIYGLDGELLYLGD